MIFVCNNGSSSYPYVIPSEYTVIYPTELRIPVLLKGEVKAKIKISPVVVFGVLSRMVVVRGS